MIQGIIKWRKQGIFEETNLIVQDATLTQRQFSFVYFTRITPQHLNFSIEARTPTRRWWIKFPDSKRFRGRNRFILTFHRLPHTQTLHHLLQSPPLLNPTPHAASKTSSPQQYCHTFNSNRNQHIFLIPNSQFIFI